MKFTESVRSFHVPLTPSTRACPPRMPSVPTSRATRVTSDANAESWSTIVLIVFLSASTSPFASTVIFRDSGRDVGDVAHLIGQVVRHAVHVLGESLPRAGDSRHVRLTTQHTLRS